MWIAETSVGDGIAIVIFATVLFLILFGIVTCVKWVFRLISGKPKPEKSESVILVLHNEHQEEIKILEESEKIRNFALHLHWKLVEAKSGHLNKAFHDKAEFFLCFDGVSADEIWKWLESEVKDYAPSQPKRVIMQRSRNRGGETTLSEVPWQPGNKPAFETPTEIQIPEGLRRLYFTGRRFAVIGIVGLFLWNGYAMISGQSENDFFGTLSGKLSAYVVGSFIIFGLLLVLVSNMGIRAHTKSVGCPYADPPSSKILTWVLFAVIVIFVFMLLLL